MSRIFDALQRSGTEQSGVEYPDMVSVATEVFEAPRRPANGDHAAEPVPAPPMALAMPDLAFEAPVTEAPATESLSENSGEFPSLEVSVTAASRLVYFSEPDSLAAEKFRFLGVRLRQMQQTRPLKKILITSTIPEEGKSMISANLALSLARKKRQRVLLIEGDLRRPTLYRSFGITRLPGVSEWLKSGSSQFRNIYHIEEAGLWFLPAGSLPENPMELMQSARLAELMEQLTVWFDWIVIDSPPMLPLEDTSVWSRLADGILLVAREGTTKKRELQRGLEMLDHSKVLGLVLNSSDSTDQGNYYQRYGQTQSAAQAKTE